MTDKIVNIGATGSIKIKEKIDLSKLAEMFDDCEYNPEQFPALTMRIDNPKSTTLIFSTGKMVITGVKKKHDLKKVFKFVLKRLNRLGVNYTNPNVSIVSKVIKNGIGRIRII